MEVPMYPVPPQCCVRCVGEYLKRLAEFLIKQSPDCKGQHKQADHKNLNEIWPGLIPVLTDNGLSCEYKSDK